MFHLNTHTFSLSVEQFQDSVTCLSLCKGAKGVSYTWHPASDYLIHFPLKLACAAEKGFALINGNSTLKYISQPLPIADIAYTRFNDGGCDSKGRFFAGTIFSKDHGVAGKLYRYDPADGTCIVVDEGPFTVGLFNLSFGSSTDEF